MSLLRVDNIESLEGATGSIFITGNIYANGAPIAGTTGAAGSSGSSGESGTSGNDGTSGSSGSAGTSGTDGTLGSSGSSGTSGTDGTSGNSGTSGTDGTSGIIGPTGDAGSSGTSGTDGTSGIIGPTGDAGSSGTSGISATGNYASTYQQFGGLNQGYSNAYSTSGSGLTYGFDPLIIGSGSATSLNFTKNQDNTTIKVFFQGPITIYDSQNIFYNRFRIAVDDDFGSLYTTFASDQTTGGVTVNATLESVFTGLPAGSHTVGIWAGPVPQVNPDTATAGNIIIGYGSEDGTNGTILISEVY